MAKVRQIVGWNGQRLGVLLGTVQGIAEVIHPGVTPPAHSCLDVTVQETLAVQQVARCDLDGVRRPSREDGVGVLEAKRLACKSPEDF